ncbi:MAG TPA: EAL domain-containing protein [Gammaproteobacteria bacterium]
MSASQNARPNYVILLPGSLALLLGGTVLLGWFLDIPALTRINPNWNPMVPSTAVCFMLSGLSLLRCRKFSDQSASFAQRIFILLILVLAGGRAIELVSGHKLGFDFLAAAWLGEDQPIGHMAPLTVIGFLMFAIGITANRRADNPKFQMLARTMSAMLLLIGLLISIGYVLNFRIYFEPEYLSAGLVWMSLPTAIGMALLGIGVWGVLLRDRRDVDAATPDLRAAQLYRATIIALTVTSIATGVAGLVFLERTVVGQTSSSMMQLLESRRDFIRVDLDNRTQLALVASSAAALNAAGISFFEGVENKSAMAQATIFAESLLARGFSGIGLEQGGRRRMIAGQLRPDTVDFISLNGDSHVALVWDKGYYLRSRVPASRPDGGKAEGYLVVEQPLPGLDELFDEANRWGETGSMPMCARLDQSRLVCFPQREQSDMYVVPDRKDDKPVPMTYALANETGVEPLIDYRGHNVLAAHGPIGNTGLGLVVRMDLAEIIAPAKRQLQLALPFIAILVGLGLWLIRLRVKPMIQDLMAAYAAEKSAMARFDAATQSSPNGFVIYESLKNPAGDIVDFRCVYANRHAMEMTGLHDERLLGHSLLELFPEQEALFTKYRTVALSQQPLVEEFSLVNHHGTRWFMRQGVAMPGGLAVTFLDITREKLLVKELEYSNRLRTAIVESAAYSIISTDVNGNIQTFNKAAERMLWYRANEIIGNATLEVFHDPEEIRNRAESLSHELGYTVAPGFEVFVAKAKTNLLDEHEWTYVRKDGSRFPVRLSVTALRDENDTLQGYLGIAYDISEQKRIEEYIRHIALHDALTGLPNRALLEDRVMVAIEQQSRKNSHFALAMIDIDRFKHINDSMGHHIGDRLLKEFVGRVKSCLRPTDTVARMGGDEFVLLLPETDIEEAANVVGRILYELETPINVGTQHLHITSSIGISLFPRDGENLHELLRCADVAMYWVKEHGRNGYKAFSREMDMGGTERLRLERDLHYALDNNGFSLFYQPMVDLKTNTVFGVEALLRMPRADGQFISPAEFIPLAEDTGLIIPIGKRVLETACQDAARMQQLLGISLTVAVNISPRQFMSGGLVDTVRDALRHANLAARQLELEITESVLMDEIRGVAAALSELNELGIKIAIDDFGTGYSSLSYLKRYPINNLKIDQSFVRDVTSDPGDAALVVAIIAMGRGLNLPVVAEGIETEEQLAFLVANECNLGQGFVIGRPMPLDGLVQWLSDNTRWKLDTTRV